MAANPLCDDDIRCLTELLDGVPAPLEPLAVAALDGFLAGVVLQPAPIPACAWRRWVIDVDGRAPPPSWDPLPLLALAERRRAEVERAIDAREWFDPWVFAGAADAPPSSALLPWVVGFALAMEHFPALEATRHPALQEPMALLFMHLDADDLEDAQALLPVIETLEPPADLAEAIQDLVRALMLMADVSRPRSQEPPTRPARSTDSARRRPARRG